MASSIEINASSSVCRMCGTAYGKLSGYFYKSYSQLYKGVGYLPICKSCTDKLFGEYLKIFGNEKDACRELCRKLDIYWSDTVYGYATKQSGYRSFFGAYLSKANVYKLAGMSYDDSLKEGGLWNTGDPFLQADEESLNGNNSTDENNLADTEVVEPEIEVDPEIKTMWGSGYTNTMYKELEERRQYWMNSLSKDGVDVSDTGIQGLLRQIVSTELEINKGRAAGEDVDKKVNTLNTLLGSAMIKPSQKKASEDAGVDGTPLGVWLWKFENKRPLPEVDEDLKDVNHIIKYITIWMKGHLAKMVGLRNSYSKLYEDEIKKLRVERPEYDDEDDETFLSDIFGDKMSSG